MNSDIKNRISFIKFMQLQLSIIIVNFNVKHFLEQCLCSVVKASNNINTEIIVVDNNSSDGSKEFFAGRFSNVTFLWNQVNIGFSRANNLALKQSTGKYILFLNPDTILPEDCLEKCLSLIQLQETVGAIGVRMIDGSGKYLKESKRGFPAPFNSLCKVLGLAALFPASKLFAGYYLGQLDPHKNHEVDVLAGAFMMIKKSVLAVTGGFDERFFMYGEDVDLSYRIQKAGFKNIYFSETTLVHFKGESTTRGSLNYVRLFYGAMILFVKKHSSSGMGRFYSLVIKFAIWINAFLSTIAFWLKRLLANKKVTTHQKRCFIVANKRVFDFIESILNKNNLAKNIVGRINPSNIREEDAVGDLQQLSFLITGKNVNEIIFCINGYSAIEAINLMEQLSSGISFRFHFEGAVSIVGSSHKSSSGDCTA